MGLFLAKELLSVVVSDCLLGQFVKEGLVQFLQIGNLFSLLQINTLLNFNLNNFFF